MKKPHAKGVLRRRLAAQVRLRREQHGWSQEKLAELAGTSQVYVSHLEAAKRAVSIDIVEQLARAFAVAPELLLMEIEEITASSHRLLRE